MEKNKPQLHVSMLNMFSRCQRQFSYRYGARFGIADQERILPPSIALIVGGTVHDVADKNYTRKLETGAAMSSEEVIDISRDICKSKMSGEVALSDDEMELGVKKVKDDATAQVAQLAVLHGAQVVSKVEPAAVEEPFVLEMPNYPIDIAGKIDLVESSGDIRDIKTSSKSLSVDDARTMQMTTYALARLKIARKYPDKITIDGLIKTKTPKLVEISDTPKDEWMSPLMRRIENFIVVIEAAKKNPNILSAADPSHWSCSKKFCGYSRICPFWSGR